jgi:hypothetical protein
MPTLFSSDMLALLIPLVCLLWVTWFCVRRTRNPWRRTSNPAPGVGVATNRSEIRASAQDNPVRGESQIPPADLAAPLPTQAPAPVAWPVPPPLGDDLAKALARLVEGGLVTVSRDAEGHIIAIELTLQGDPLRRTKYQFDSDGRLLEYQDYFGGVPECDESYRFDGSGKCIAWSKSRYDGAWDWWGEVKFDDAGNLVDSMGVLAREMTKQPNFGAADLPSVVRSLVSDERLGVQ